MKKAKVFTKGKHQYIRLPEEFHIEGKELLFQEHKLGLLIIDPKKRWKLLKKVMGKAGDDFFPNGREQEIWTEREDLD